MYNNETNQKHKKYPSANTTKKTANNNFLKYFLYICEYERTKRVEDYIL